MSYKLQTKRLIFGLPIFIVGLVSVQIIKKISEESIWHMVCNAMIIICFRLGGFLIWFFWVSLIIWAIKNKRQFR